MLILSFSFVAHGAQVPILKVRVAKSRQKVLVSGMDLKRYIWPKKSLRKFAGFKKIKFNCVSRDIKKIKKPIRLATIKTSNGMIHWDQEKYKGVIHIQTDEKLNGCDIINETTLEDYLATLLPKEMSSNWPLEALKAQAVAARSYAYYKVKTAQVSRAKGFKTNYDLENSEKHQVNGSLYDVTRKTIKATKQTAGEILTLENEQITPVFFHSKCGGKTLTPGQVWQNRLPGYASVNCPFCHKHGLKNWKHKLSKQKVLSTFQKVLKQFNGDYSRFYSNSVQLAPDSRDTTRLRFYNDGDLKVIKKSRLRALMGRSNLPSNYYSLKMENDNFVVSGAGYGHGVGMCQFGAKELALQGYNYKQILAHYFPKMKLNKIY